MNIKPIRAEKDYEIAIKRVGIIFDASPDSKEIKRNYCKKFC